MKSKKKIAILLAAVLSLSGISFTAQAANATSAEQTVRALGIMNGDESGNMNLSGQVTRAQFAKMLVSASSFKDNVSDNAGVSPFRDVTYSHWSAGYVKIAAENGWVSGYLDGNFRPDNTIKLEEAASAILTLLGYSASDLVGAYPNAQISKIKALGLMDGVNKTQGQPLTREDCMYLFYNLMSATTKSGQTYGTTLGYTVSATGEVSYSGMVTANVKGPIVVEDVSNWTASIPFAVNSAVVYRNSSLSTASAVAQYDVVYYNASMNTIWAYSTKVTGLYTAASPSAASPSSVTVGGSTYTLSSTKAAYQLSTMGDFALGDVVTLLIGMDGGVAGVISAGANSEDRYGVVVSSGAQGYQDGMGGLHTVEQVTVLCTDGRTQQYVYDPDNTDSSDNVEVGSMVQITHTGTKTGIKKIYSKTISGTVNAKGTVLGSTAFADNVEIIDVNKYGDYAVLYPVQLAGKEITANDVAYYVTDSAHKISKLILKDSTGYIHGYGVLTSAKKTFTENELTGVTNMAGAYTVLTEDGIKTATTSGKFYSASTGPVILEYEGGEVVDIRSLESTNIISISGLTAKTSSRNRAIANGVQVYIRNGSTYYESNLAAVQNNSQYTLTGFYDDYHAGKDIRVIIAVEK